MGQARSSMVVARHGAASQLEADVLPRHPDSHCRLTTTLSSPAIVLGSTGFQSKRELTGLCSPLAQIGIVHGTSGRVR